MEGFLHIFKFMNFGVIELDKKGRVIIMDDSSKRIIGKDLIKKTIYRTIPELREFIKDRSKQFDRIIINNCMIYLFRLNDKTNIYIVLDDRTKIFLDKCYDLKNPLNQIFGFIQILQMDNNQTSQNRKIIKDIYNASYKMSNIIKNITNEIK